MTVNISYMGTKRQLAPHVANMIADDRAGPLLDIFSGISAISSFIAPARPVWCNDAQLFASTVAKAFFVAPGMPPSSALAMKLLKPLYNKNKTSLNEKFQEALAHERDAIEQNDLPSFIRSQNIPNIQTCPSLNRERLSLQRCGRTPYRLFCITFAGGYFGISQTIEIDSLKYAIDTAVASGAVSEDTHRWLNLALCQAMSKVASTTGHFAQFLTIKPSNLRRLCAQRRRSIVREFGYALSGFKPVRDRKWRKQNRAFNTDAISLLKSLNRKGRSKPSIIYADPPYSADQYSRYYHIYETLLLYDYPDASGIGRYRPDRFVSPFSIKTKVAEAIEEVVALSASMRAKLVLSYPGVGLLPDAEASIKKMLKRHYGATGPIKRLAHWHSSMGASKGVQQHQVQEIIFSAG